jgi:glycosyltransferase involved in cell wall biosynthesis
VRILIATDSFPPGCGGSGWSTYEVARGLRRRGHDLTIVQPVLADRVTSGRRYDGFAVEEFPFHAPPYPYLRNYWKNERLHRALEPLLQRMVRERGIDLIHAQHVLTGLPSIRAASVAGVPSVCTVRDYWPVCYWSDLILDYGDERLCPACSAGMMTRCVGPRAGRAWPLALPMIPYMLSNLARKRRGLAAADAIVAVSSTIASDIQARAPEIRQTRVEIIPNPVDLAGVRQIAGASPRPMPDPYALYVGKLAPNKGVSKLWRALSYVKLPYPLIIVGDGPDRPKLEGEAAKHGHDVRFVGWLPREQVFGWMKHAELLVFPSHGPESLSRVLLESAALGVPIAAMNTGGTPDIIRHEETGLLSRDADELGSHVARLVTDRQLARRLGDAAREHVTAAFSTDHVIARLEALYRELIGRTLRGRRG